MYNHINNKLKEYLGKINFNLYISILLTSLCSAVVPVPSARKHPRHFSLSSAISSPPYYFIKIKIISSLFLTPLTQTYLPLLFLPHFYFPEPIPASDPIHLHILILTHCMSLYIKASQNQNLSQTNLLDATSFLLGA